MSNGGQYRNGLERSHAAKQRGGGSSSSGGGGKGSGCALIGYLLAAGGVLAMVAGVKYGVA